MRIPSAEAARASTQAILLAYLCDRYHDLATYASEPLKQRVHFLTKPDGSNLKDLFIWDTPLSARSFGGATPCWTPNQIQDYIHQHWSADQFPLHPPIKNSSWESVDIYFKELDQETIQAMVPIGVQDGVTLLVVLIAELDLGDNQDQDSSSAKGKKTVWRYHDMVAVMDTDWEKNDWTILLPEHHHPQEPKPFDELTTETDPEADGEEKEDGSEEDDTDNDYWGQYGDAEDDESAADETNAKSKRNQDPSGAGATSEAPLGEDDEEELYWRKYSEQQEEQEALERKKKMQEQPQSHQRQQQPLLDHLGAQESSKGPTPLPGQVNPNMLSSLLQSLVMEGVQQMHPSSFSELDQQQKQEQGQGREQHRHQASVNLPVAADGFTTSDSPLPSSTILQQDNTSNLVDDGASQSKLMDSMRSLVADFTRAGYSKDQVFVMLETVYISQL
ncbi:hypothetical protein BGX29_004543 [Mortierella sp. GBA35]|nr:hypothetical protein BGX29_004543 [Mortierella sp. GBA35]